jgi:hypothetical protein
MSYSIQRTNGTVAATINDGEYDSTSTSLTLVGQNFVGYGEFLQSNLVKIMENFAYSQAPEHASVGQLWFDTDTKRLSVHTSKNPSIWRNLATSTASAAAPSAGATTGDLWFNTVDAQFFANTGSTWSLIGPTYTKNQGVTGAIAVDVLDDSSDPHTTIAFKVDNAIAAIWNSETPFTTDGSITGFDVLNSGFNISSLYSNTTYHGTANNAVYMQGFTPSSFVRRDINQTMSGNLGINNDNGLWIGSDYNLQITTDALSKDVTIYNNHISGEFALVGTNNSGSVTLLTSDVNTGLLTVYANPTANLGIATKQYVDTRITSLNVAQTVALTANVGAINNTIGVLTGEINDVSVYSQNVNTVKANIASPNFTGTPTAPTASPGDSTVQLATTAFVAEANAGVYSTLIDVTTVITNDIVSNYAPLVSPTLTGTPNAPTAIPLTNTEQIATTAFVTAAVQTANAAVTTTLAAKSNIASPTFSGAPKAPTAAVTVANTQIATTAFVHSLLPTGIILMWSGSVATVPTGWALCNGSNGTPDLRNRFIIGAGSTYNPNTTGGGLSLNVTSATGGSHTHGGTTGGTSLSTNQMPNHTHDFYDVYAIDGDQTGNYNLVSGTPTYPGGTPPAWYSGLKDVDGNFVTPYYYMKNATDGDYDGGAYAFKNRTLTNTGGGSQAHNHSIPLDSGHTHSITLPVPVPAYYALCYIMKTS